MMAGGINYLKEFIMKKCLLSIVLLSCILAIVSAQELYSSAEETDLTANGLILPDSGLQIVKASEIDSKNSVAMEKEFRQEFLKKRKEMEKNGYAKTHSNDAIYLLSMRDKKPTTAYDSEPHDTHLKTELSKITLAFPYNAKFSIPQEYVIGFSPRGGFINGWTGFSVYFNHPEMGVCKYALTNMKISHGGIRLIEEEITYDVNNKATDSLVEGSDSSGFFYSVGWYDNTYMQELDCATPKFNPIIKSKIISYARKLDSNVN